MNGHYGVLISGNGSTMQCLTEIPEIKIKVVISSSADAYGVLRARRMGIPVEVVPKEIGSKDKKLEAEKWIILKLKEYGVKNLFLAGYMKIVSSSFLNDFKLHCDGHILNIHPSKLPDYKGLDAYESAIKNGEKLLGVTIHHVNEEVDAGEYVSQRTFVSSANKLSLHIHEQTALRETMRKVIRL